MKEVIKIKGMSCRSCENTIKTSLLKIEGIKTVSVSFKTGLMNINYNNEIITRKDIEKAIGEIGYEVSDKKNNIIKEIAFIALLGLLVYIMGTIIRVPKIEETVSYGMLFIIGLLTSFHCIFMCGGINLAATANKGYRGGIMYNLGRIVSYTLIGGVIGALGGVISFNQTTKDLINIFVGTIMFIMGLQMLRIITLPKIKLFKKPKVNANTPFLIGMLNGFMPCGPLQAMQLYALSTGSFIKGATAMFIFSSGTVPLMLAFSFFGALSIGKKARLFKKTGAIIILIFGLFTVIRSVELPTISSNKIPNNAIYAIDKGTYQEVTVRFERGKYLPIVVEEDKKVVWNIIMETGDLNGCNDEIYIPEFEITQKLKYGTTTIEFTPSNKGTYKYTCWMNMLYNNIYVVEEINNK